MACFWTVYCNCLWVLVCYSYMVDHLNQGVKDMAHRPDLTHGSTPSSAWCWPHMETVWDLPCMPNPVPMVPKLLGLELHCTRYLLWPIQYTSSTHLPLQLVCSRCCVQHGSQNGYCMQHSLKPTQVGTGGRKGHYGSPTCHIQYLLWLVQDCIECSTHSWTHAALYPPWTGCHVPDQPQWALIVGWVEGVCRPYPAHVVALSCSSSL